MSISKAKPVSGLFSPPSSLELAQGKVARAAPGPGPSAPVAVQQEGSCCCEVVTTWPQKPPRLHEQLPKHLSVPALGPAQSRDGAGSWNLELLHPGAAFPPPPAEPGPAGHNPCPFLPMENLRADPSSQAGLPTARPVARTGTRCRVPQPLGELLPGT